MKWKSEEQSDINEKEQIKTENIKKSLIFWKWILFITAVILLLSSVLHLSEGAIENALNEGIVLVIIVLTLVFAIYYEEKSKRNL